MVVLSSALATLVVVVATTGPDVRGAVVCPGAEEVAVRLSPMLSADAGFPLGAFVELADVPASVPGLLDVEIRLRNVGEAAPLAVRRVERGGGCSETADAVAVIAASWAGRYASPPPLPLPDSALPEPPAVATARASAPPEPASSGTKFSVGAVVGIVAASAGGSAVLAGGEVEARRARWVLRLTVAGMGERSIPFPPGSAGWRRLMVLPTIGTTWGSPRAFAEIAAGPTVALTETQGRGFATNASDTGVDVGLVPTFRLGARLAALSATIWIGGSALIWLRPHSVSLDGQTPKPVPRWDGFLGGGLIFLLDS